MSDKAAKISAFVVWSNAHISQQIAAKIEAGEPVTAPGIPDSYSDPLELVTNNCLKPELP